MNLGKLMTNDRGCCLEFDCFTWSRFNKSAVEFTDFKQFQLVEFRLLCIHNVDICTEP